MKRKIIGFLVCTLLITTILPITVSSDEMESTKISKQANKPWNLGLLSIYHNTKFVYDPEFTPYMEVQTWYLDRGEEAAVGRVELQTCIMKVGSIEGLRVPLIIFFNLKTLDNGNTVFDGIQLWFTRIEYFQGIETWRKFSKECTIDKNWGVEEYNDTTGLSIWTVPLKLEMYVNFQYHATREYFLKIQEEGHYE